MTTKKWVHYASTLAMGVSALAVSAPALAQQAAAATADDTDQSAIVVTARRREERLTDVPAAITVVSTEQLMAKGITSPTDLVHAVPSLQQSSSGFGNATPHFLIRGQRQQLEFIQSDQSVGVYVDDVVVPRQQGLNAGLFDIANVQVLKGPQGTLFGKNQTGGAILFTSQMPKNETGGFVTVTGGNMNAKRIEGAINIAVSDSLQIRAAGMINRRDGYMFNVTDRRYYNDQHTDGWRISAHLAPAGTDIENWLIVAGSKQKEIGAITQLPKERLGLPGVGVSALFAAFGNPAGDALATASLTSEALSYGKFETGGVSQYQLPDGSNIDIDNFSVTNKTELHLADNFTLRNIFGYRSLDSYQSSSMGGTAGFLAIPGTTAANLSAARLLVPAQANGTPQPSTNVVCGPQSGVGCVAAAVFDSANYTKQRQYSEEINLLGNAFNKKVDYIFGFYYFHESGTGITSNFTPISNGARMGTAQNQPANESTALFGQLTWHPTPTISLTGGLRQTWDERETNARSVTIVPDYWPWTGGLIPADGVSGKCALVGNAGTLPNNTAANPNNCLFSGNAHFSKMTYTFSADWHPTPDTLLYAVTRRGYRSGGFNQSATVNTTLQPTVLTPFQPETVTDYEVGLKGNWTLGSGMRAGLNIAAYRNNYNNIQRALTSLAGNKSVTANAANATIKGIEVEARFEPTSWLELTGYYSYIDAKFKTFFVVANGLYRDTGDFSKSKFSGVPTDSGGASVTLHTELPGDMGRISATADYYGQTGTYLQDGNFISTTQTYIAADYIPGYWLLGANIGWRNVMGKPLDLNFNVRNLNNKRYADGGVDGSTSGIGSVAWFLGAPRTWTLSASYHF